jgi:hypothetical protein
MKYYHPNNSSKAAACKVLRNSVIVVVTFVLIGFLISLIMGPTPLYTCRAILTVRLRWKCWRLGLKIW